jgi:hypothetical protein
MRRRVGRVLVTLGCAAVAVGIGFVPVPGLALDFGGETLRPALSVGMLGVAPLISGALLVEIAALVHPRTRALRVGGRQARSGLRQASFFFALVLAAIQSYFLMRWAESLWFFDHPAPPPMETWSAIVFGASGIGATALLALLADWITRHGVGNGFSVLIGAASLDHAAMALVDVGLTLDDRIQPVDWLAVASVCALLVYVTVLMLRRRTIRHGTAPPVHVPAPASGLAPIGGAAVAYQIVSLGFFPDTLLVGDAPLPPLHAPYYWDVFVPVAVVLAALWTALFYRGDAVADAWIGWERERTGTEPSRTAVLVATTRARWHALSWTVAFVLGLAIADAWLATEGVGLSAIALVVLTAIVRDIASTWRFTAAHGDVTSVDEFHRLYLLPIVLEHLESAGIPAHARSTGHRTLLQFFGPYVPVEIIVPTSRATEASAIVDARRRAA